MDMKRFEAINKADKDTLIAMVRSAWPYAVLCYCSIGHLNPDRDRDQPYYAYGRFYIDGVVVDASIKGDLWVVTLPYSFMATKPSEDEILHKAMDIANELSETWANRPVKGPYVN